MAGGEPDSSLRDSLLALPRGAVWTSVGLLAIGVGVGFALVLGPNLSSAARGAGGQLLLISLPALSLAVLALGAGSARTARIDSLVARFVSHTVGDKLQAYLVAAPTDERQAALFDRMERHPGGPRASYCDYAFFDKAQRRFDVTVKSNVFNIEIGYTMRLGPPLPEAFDTPPGAAETFDSLDDWPAASKHPAIALAPGTFYGSLAEGYSIYADCRPDADRGGVCVVLRLRQRLRENLLTSPYLRRYFAEDAAIATSFFFAEALGSRGVHIRNGEHTERDAVSGPSHDV
ncbi:MAG: hypothetical protein QOH12_821 [Solirubrobacteraceae bacterium]|jgi:hypothetical protein|nr:hypothetical protein [Solirubrobacteraceae bacterium]